MGIVLGFFFRTAKRRWGGCPLLPSAVFFTASATQHGAEIYPGSRPRMNSQKCAQSGKDRLVQMWDKTAFIGKSVWKINPSSFEWCHLRPPHTHTHIPTSARLRQTTQTVSSARQPCHPSADGRIWSCLFYSNLIHLNPVAVQCLLKDFGNIRVWMCVCVCVPLLHPCFQNQKLWGALAF